MIIVNTGGTFNKVYNPISGELEVPTNSNALQEIVNKFTYNIELKGLIYKDSLDINSSDREELFELINSVPQTEVVIVHGTDTMDITASFLAKKNINKKIILTGAMVPYSIDSQEATSNLSLAIGYLKATSQNGVYIAMQGVVGDFKTITKNRERGVFEYICNN